jgi:transcriptional regulator with XRE-family HTH domain
VRRWNVYVVDINARETNVSRTPLPKDVAMIVADGFYETLGAAIKGRRDALGITQAEIALHLGLSRTSITNIERGRQRLLIDQFCRLAELLQCDRDDLLRDAVAMASISNRQKPKAVPASVDKFVKSLNEPHREP